MTNFTAEFIARGLSKYKVSGKGFLACCPAHEDTTPSLSISEGENGHILVHCHAGCSQADVINRLTQLGLWGVTNYQNRNSENEIIYSYYDEHKTLLFEKVRRPGKSFQQRRKDSKGNYIYDLKGVRRVLYNLPSISSAQPDDVIFITEGEKDAETLIKHGFLATTSPSGANGWQPEYSEALAGKNVVVIGDNDPPGLKHVGNIISSLQGKAKNIKSVELPPKLNEIPVKDITDWFEAGGTADTLVTMIADVAHTTIAPSNKSLMIVDLYDFLRLELPDRELILPWMTSQSLNMIYAQRGVGKTFFALEIAYAIATGGEFLGWKADKPRNVLYLDGEMAGWALQERLRLLDRSTELKPERNALNIITPDLQNVIMPDLATAEGQKIIDDISVDAEVIIIDNLSCLVRGTGRENEAESWLIVQGWALKKRSEGKSLIFIHHSNKSGTQRGTSKKEDVLDTVIRLSWPSDYNAEEGARFEVKFEKSRHFKGKDAAPLVARLHIDIFDKRSWEFEQLEDNLRFRVQLLHQDGMKQKDIADELGIAQSTVSKMLRVGTVTVK